MTAEDGTLVVTPPARLTRQDCLDCRRWRWHLLMFLGHVATVASVAPRTPPPEAACPHCDSPEVESLGRAWWFCACCSQTFQTPEVPS